ncbi:hypothetical protein [Chitinimonas koreensis]|uniref:hypothetical protein n=1 Tax=Chitinimonas koreensis TaxID=356302 RepID=UPI0004128DC6|nr:hypothetical protein [Chitinimonas koreensis]QNM98242.1 citryl-CoA lyase [Chitinimonas koreensis]
MSGPATLAQHNGPFRTQAGACFPGDRAVFRGHDLHADLRDIDWMELYLFGITGRRIEPRQREVLHVLWTCTSYPDARLWNNRVAALVGAGRGTGAMAIGAAIAVSEAAIYGWQPEFTAADFLHRARRRVDAGETLEAVVKEELARHRLLLGYGRPVATLEVDERITVVVELLEKLGLGVGPHLALAFEVERTLLALGRRLPINYAAAIAAVSLDLGLSPRECYLFFLPSFMAGMPPCYQEAAAKPEGATFALRCAQIDYTGPAKRDWDAGPA